MNTQLTDSAAARLEAGWFGDISSKMDQVQNCSPLKQNCSPLKAHAPFTCCKSQCSAKAQSRHYEASHKGPHKRGGHQQAQRGQRILLGQLRQ